MESSKAPGWKKPLLIGCVVLSLLGIGALLLVVLNWSRISGFVEEATSTMQELNAVRTVLQERFRAPQVFVKLKTTSGAEGSTLVIEVVNAPFFRELMIDGPEGHLMAFEMAGAARAALSDQARYAHYEVSFATRTGSGVSVSQARVYLFEPKDLQPPPSFIRSGTDSNDEVEEPLRADALRYQAALETSNTCIEHFRSSDYASVYSLCGNELHGLWDQDTFVGSYRQILDKVGAIERYKPMQWKFTLRESNGRRLLYSTKIVEHERAVMNYHFVFDADGEYKSPVGIHWNSRSIETGAGAPK